MLCGYIVVVDIICYLIICCILFLFFFFKQKTAYELRISDWSSDVCSSDLPFHSPSGVSGSPSITRGGAPASTRVIGTPRPLVATVATGAPLSTATKGADRKSVV